MKFRMDELIQSIADAFDAIEAQLLGASSNHGKRIAVLCAAMGQEFDLDEATLSTLTTCALFHDNALTEYINEEHLNDRKTGRGHTLSGKHCIYGQRNVDQLPLPASARDLVLYHHERADGKGPFQKREGECPLGAELIAIADSVDVSYHLQRISPEQLPDLKETIRQRIGTKYTARAARAFCDVLDDELLLSLHDDRIHETAQQLIPRWEVEVGEDTLLRLADFVARIIDYKSNFTRKHTVQIANRSWIMTDYYLFSRTEKVKVYLACALHDLGKLYIPSEVLEKPGKLTDAEFTTITDHVRYTYKLLEGIQGFEELCAWASNHHEKLDGSGYPFGLKDADIDFVSRLLACLDIYQAVSEERPYHPGRSHEETMPILYDMAEKGKIDPAIVKDMDLVMKNVTVDQVDQAVS